MLVRQSTDCSGNGNSSSVTVPFSIYFTGFEPFATGTVTAYTQPGGEEVGSRSITLGPDGSRCYRVTGDVPPGQYKIVYDFGSGTGKQKVIRIEGAAPTPSPTPTKTPTKSPTSSPSVTPTVSPTVTSSVSPSVSPTVTSSVSPSGSATGSPSASPSESESVLPTSTAAPSESEDVEGLTFTPVDTLPDTGSSHVSRNLSIGAGLVVLGSLLVAVSLRRRPRAH